MTLIGKTNRVVIRPVLEKIIKKRYFRLFWVGKTLTLPTPSRKLTKNKVF